MAPAPAAGADRNQHGNIPMIRIELTGSDTASTEGIKVQRPRGPICAIARKLVDADHDPDQIVECYRNGKLAIMAKPLWHWAVIRVEESDSSDQSARIRVSAQSAYFSPKVNALIARAGGTCRVLSGHLDISGTMTPETEESPSAGQHHHQIRS